MIYKKIRILFGIKYYRTKLRLSLDSSYYYEPCCHCVNLRFKLYDDPKCNKNRCTRINEKYASGSCNFRYYPYAPKKKIYI